MNPFLAGITVFVLCLIGSGLITNFLEEEVVYNTTAVVLLLGGILIVLFALLDQVQKLRIGLLGDESEETDHEPETRPEAT